MENNHKLTLFIAYYLAKYDIVALKNLGFKNWEQAFNEISLKLGVKKHSVRNWRDVFDPLFGYRSGWHQRPMSPSRTNVAVSLENLDEPELRAIVLDILSEKTHGKIEKLSHLFSIVDDNSVNCGISSFISRGPTGKKSRTNFY